MPVRGPASLFFLVAGLALGGCASLGPGGFATWQVEAPADSAALDFHGIPVRTGQILVSEQGTPNSLFLSLLVAENRPFVHSAVVVVEDGWPVVYEANGRLRPGIGGRPPTETLQGGVRRLDLATFLTRNRFIALYDLPAGADPARIAAFAQASHRRQVPFDPYFDGTDPSRVYCSEFVALALAAGGVGQDTTLPLTPNASVGVILDWLGIRTPGIIPPASLVAGFPRVGLFSREDSPAQMHAWFAVKAELHRRFTPDQKLGNVLQFNSWRGLRFPPEVAGFMDAANTAAAGWTGLPDLEIDQRVRALAGEWLGPFPASY